MSTQARARRDSEKRTPIVDPDDISTWPNPMGCGVAAQILKVTPKTIQRWADDGTLAALPPTKGGHRRFTPRAVQATKESYLP